MKGIRQNQKKYESLKIGHFTIYLIKQLNDDEIGLNKKVCTLPKCKRLSFKDKMKHNKLFASPHVAFLIKYFSYPAHHNNLHFEFF